MGDRRVRIANDYVVFLPGGKVEKGSADELFLYPFPIKETAAPANIMELVVPMGVAVEAPSGSPDDLELGDFMGLLYYGRSVLLMCFSSFSLYRFWLE